MISKDRCFGVLQSQRSEMQKVSNEAEEEPRLWHPESQIKTLFHRGRDRLFQISPRDPIHWQLSWQLEIMHLLVLVDCLSCIQYLAPFPVLSNLYILLIFLSIFPERWTEEKCGKLSPGHFVCILPHNMLGIRIVLSSVLWYVWFPFTPCPIVWRRVSEYYAKRYTGFGVYRLLPEAELASWVAIPFCHVLIHRLWVS